jgi:hypothetical protein
MRMRARFRHEFEKLTKAYQTKMIFYMVTSGTTFGSELVELWSANVLTNRRLEISDLRLNIT